jgi:hypothetical protein
LGQGNKTRTETADDKELERKIGAEFATRIAAQLGKEVCYIGEEHEDGYIEIA